MKSTFDRYAPWALLIILVGLLVMLWSYDASASPTAPASPGSSVTLCHAAGREGTIKFITLTIPYNAAFGQAGHFNEDGTPNAGHEEDYLGPCQDSESTTTTTSPSTTTSPPTSSTTTTSSSSTTSTIPPTTSSTTPATSTTSTGPSTTSVPTTSVPSTTTTSGSVPPSTLPFTGMRTDAGALSILAGAASLIGLALVKLGRVR